MPPLTYQLPPEQYRAALELRHTLYGLHFAGAILDLIVFWALLRFGAAQRLRNLAESTTEVRFLQAMLFVPMLLAVPRLVALPISAWRHHLAVRFGLSVQSWSSWLGDWVLSAGIWFGVAALAAWGFFALLRRYPRRWWFYGWLGAIPCTLAGVFVAPIVIDPLFYRFDPLPAATAEALEAVCASAGVTVPRERMFQMKAGVKTKSVNAYMAGFGSTRRIVVWDTTLKVLSTAQLQSVFAHELGHYALRHIPIGIALSMLGVLILLRFGDFAIRWTVGRWGPHWGLRGPSDWAVLPIGMFLVVALTNLGDPMVNGISRWQEHQADVYELDRMKTLVPHAGRISAEVDQIMSAQNLDDPAPPAWIRWWLYDHPDVHERMRFAQEYAP